MRGDRPEQIFSQNRPKRFTPHARGSTQNRRNQPRVEKVYPACAGIDPGQDCVDDPGPRLPRMRGDRPVFRKLGQDQPGFTPHARGSTPGAHALPGLSEVYPACAGIDLYRLPYI